MDSEEKPLVSILDTSAFFLHLSFQDKILTVSKVIDEIKDLRGKARLEVLIEQGLIIRDPHDDSISEVLAAAEKSGDRTVLSPTDIDILALALELKGEVYTDDFALQNTARKLGVNIHPIIQRKSIEKKWKLRCSGCGKYYSSMPDDSVCGICGSPVKRKIK
ncbi:NOB1 family endonuclease [Methanospirillum stamsii]|uniref:Endoribonuclease Nob1 n=1 Tax=Methanospirillum stamsii TaxID=1277351 RepID=A0A2V2MZN5_9EURY|nr:nucleotide-binding protein [Methanospirillum stamsii]PWR71790.1 nucleotide-binding protein [Methanospirillum stamsii]